MTNQRKAESASNLRKLAATAIATETKTVQLSLALAVSLFLFVGTVHAQYTFTLPLVNNSGTVGSVALIQGMDTSNTDNRYTIPTPTIGTCPGSFSDVPVGMMVLLKAHKANTVALPCLDICNFGHTGGSCASGTGDELHRYGDDGLSTSPSDLVTFNQALLIWDGTN